MSGGGWNKFGLKMELISDSDYSTPSLVFIHLFHIKSVPIDVALIDYAVLMNHLNQLHFRTELCLFLQMIVISLLKGSTLLVSTHSTN